MSSNSIYQKINSSIVSSFVEVCVTHPIDYYKTLKQKNVGRPFELWKKMPYKGFISRFIGVVPMRTLYWGTIEYLKYNKYPNYMIPLLTASSQIVVDYPIEQMKVNQMNGRNMCYIPSRSNVFSGFLAHYVRNILFTCGFFYGDLMVGSPFIGGAIGSLISHPFDTLKTIYQSDNKLGEVNMRMLYRGAMYRNMISMISLGVGWNVYRFVQDKQKLFDK